ncbi:MAG: GDSL-type esterase/lipase family protein [Minicystis sp.]
MGNTAFRRRIGKLAIALGALLIALVAAELVVRRLMKRGAEPRAAQPELAIRCGSCARLFTLNPEAPGISPQGLRDRAFSPTPQDGALRVLVLGDSMPYGLGVAADATFPKAMERALREKHPEVEVINAGVPAYQPYNELGQWKETARNFKPHVVVLSVCMNDVADPVLHWAPAFPNTKQLLDMVPAAAIPNAAYHRDHVIPQLVEKRRAKDRFPARYLQRLALYRMTQAAFPASTEVTVSRDGKLFPAHVVGEDSISLAVLDDYDSAEWAWLRKIYDQLIDAVRADGAAIAVVVNPLSYQLDPAYPLHPEIQFRRYFVEKSIPYLDSDPHPPRAPIGAALRRQDAQVRRHLALHAARPRGRRPRPRRIPRRAEAAREAAALSCVRAATAAS